MSNAVVSRELIDWDKVQARVGGMSKPTVWRMRRRGEFPEPVRISPGRVAWFSDEIDAWIASRSIGRAA